jgi:hypothetical protein
MQSEPKSPPHYLISPCFATYKSQSLLAPRSPNEKFSILTTLRRLHESHPDKRIPFPIATHLQSAGSARHPHIRSALTTLISKNSEEFRKTHRDKAFTERIVDFEKEIGAGQLHDAREWAEVADALHKYLRVISRMREEKANGLVDLSSLHTIKKLVTCKCEMAAVRLFV